jgi:flagellar hook-length control protein FliK
VDISNTQTAMDAAALLAQAAQLLPTAPTSARDMTASQVAAQTASPQALSPLGRPAKGLADAATPVAAPLNQAPEAPAQGPRKLGKGQPDPSTLAQQASSAATTAATGSNAAVDARASQVEAKAQAISIATVVPPALLAAVVNSARREDEGRERSAFKPAAPDGVPGVANSAPTGATSTSLINPTAAASPADLYVAEQVKYWISNDVKNAEMRLDGIGNNPVEVSISMHGNEAHVAFRSDEPQARDVLEAASSHLKDLLQREGLVLSGVSVGTTGSGGAGQQERKEQQGARQAKAIAAAQSAAAPGASGAARASGRALDLFV